MEKVQLPTGNWTVKFTVHEEIILGESSHPDDYPSGTVPKSKVQRQCYIDAEGNSTWRRDNAQIGRAHV